MCDVVRASESKIYTEFCPSINTFYVILTDLKLFEIMPEWVRLLSCQLLSASMLCNCNTLFNCNLLNVASISIAYKYAFPFFF